MKPHRHTVPILLSAALLVVVGVVIVVRIHHKAATSVVRVASRSAGIPPAIETDFRPEAETTVPTSPNSAPISVPLPPEPSAADEEALLRLLEDAKHEAAPAVRHERLVAICQRWAGFDPPAAIALALELKLDPLEGALLPNLAQQWAARDFDAAQAWAEKLSPGDLRDQVYSRLIYEKALAEPAAAARLLSLMRPAGGARDEATVTVVHAWAQRDLSEASAWVGAFADGPVRERCLAELAARARSSARGGAGATDAIRD